MPQPRKLVKLTLQNEVHELRNGSPTPQPRTCSFTISFYDLIKFSFREWLIRQKDQELFNSAKWIKYQWFLEDSNNEICGTKEEKAIKFNKHYDLFNNFVLKDNELYQWAFKVGQSKRLVIYDYNTVEIIEKV